LNGQAYTQELEIKVSQLEEENERLRRQNVCFNSFVSVHLCFILVSCADICWSDCFLPSWQGNEWLKCLLVIGISTGQ